MPWRKQRDPPPRCCGTKFSIVSMLHFPTVFNQTVMERAGHFSPQAWVYHCNCPRIKVYFNIFCDHVLLQEDQMEIKYTLGTGTTVLYTHLLNLIFYFFVCGCTETCRSKCKQCFTEAKKENRKTGNQPAATSCLCGHVWVNAWPSAFDSVCLSADTQRASDSLSILTCPT